MDKKMNKHQFESPAILKVIPVAMESAILSGSVVTKDTAVKTTGQKVYSYDFTDTSFNQDWE